MTIINDDARIVNKFDASLTDDARVVIYDHHMFIVQATGFTWHFVNIWVTYVLSSWPRSQGKSISWLF